MSAASPILSIDGPGGWPRILHVKESGSRWSRDYPDLERVRKFVRGLAEHDRDITVVSGNARGVDRVAEKEARKIGLSVVSLPADWDAHGQVAGFLRNGQIVERCDIVAAFWDGSSNGTEDTVSKATAAGKRISIWGPVGEKIRGLKGMLLHRDSQLVKGCRKCGLCRTRKSTVFGQGNSDAKLVFIGEGPGHDEDESGLAFVGRAGKKLTALIEGMGLSRDDVFICNIVKCRPPGNRNPEPNEVAACSPYLYKQLEIVAPEVAVALGACAAKLLLRTDEGIGRLRGRFHELCIPRSSPISLMPTYHPAYLLRNPADTKKVADDLKLVAGRLGVG